MRYLLLIYSSETDDPTLQPRSDEEQQAELKRWFDYTDELDAAGVNLGGEALHPPSTATTVRVRDGETLTTDGPFAETKEVLGGYYLLDVADADEAIKWAQRCPAADYGSIELRPIMEFDS